MIVSKLKRELKKPFLWQAGRLACGVSRKGAFLHRAGWILACISPSRRRFWALRLLSLSPHYFGYQWTGRYEGRSRAEVLEAESDRNARSRRQICDGLLRPYLRTDFTVLDFGCGPGYLARETARYVTKVLAVDISSGVLACARELNGAPNIDYIDISRSGLAVIKDASVDFLYSTAVIQHLREEVAREVLAEIRRILKPGASGLCHIIIGTGKEPRPANWQFWIQAPVTHYTEHELISMARNAGFNGARLVPVRELAHIDDDVGGQHVLFLSHDRDGYVVNNRSGSIRAGR